MKLDKKQLPQFIILGVLVVAFVGYLSFSALRPKDSASPPSAEQAAAPSTQPAVEEQGSEQLALAGAFSDLAVAATRRDPFTPQIRESSACPTTPAASPNTGGRVANSAGRLLPINPFAGATGGSVPPILPVEEKDPEFVITGVIRGAENVAIIRVGEGGRHVVKQGQLIDGRYKVLRVSNDGAVLAYKNRRIYLKLGGAKNAS